jgi:hypothetical protein
MHIDMQNTEGDLGVVLRSSKLDVTLSLPRGMDASWSEEFMARCRDEDGHVMT